MDEIAALYVHRKAPFVPLRHGGHQERSRRGSTESVVAIVGLGTAATLALQKLLTEDRTVPLLRDALEQSILTALPTTTRNGHPHQHHPLTALPSRIDPFGVRTACLRFPAGSLLPFSGTGRT